jgi:hypothetical protein
MNTHQPDFQFLTNLADFHFDRIDQRPPLASAIQSFETCLFLISINRFPSALTSCAMAIESAWKAATNAGQENKSDFATILGEVNNIFPSTAPSFNLKDFRKLRNDVVHFGYSPKDDEISAQMIFSTGIPVFFLFVKSHPNLSIDLHSCIEPDIADQLSLTLKLNTIGNKRTVSSIESSKILSHMIKRMNSNLTIWQESALDDGNLSQHLEFEAKTELKNMLLRNWHCSETIRCPVCEENDLIVRLEEEQISKGNLHGINAHCIHCDLNLQAPLLNIFLQKSFGKEQRDKILESYGIRIQK